jgi:hypothetical protein
MKRISHAGGGTKMRRRKSHSGGDTRMKKKSHGGGGTNMKTKFMVGVAPTKLIIMRKKYQLLSERLTPFTIIAVAPS